MSNIIRFPEPPQALEPPEVEAVDVENRDPIADPRPGDRWTDGRFTRTFHGFAYRKEFYGVKRWEEAGHWRAYTDPRDWHDRGRGPAEEESTHVSYETPSHSNGYMPIARWRAWCCRSRLVQDGEKLRTENRAKDRAKTDAQEDNVVSVLGFLRYEEVPVEARPVGHWHATSACLQHNVDAWVTGRVAHGDVELKGREVYDGGPDPYLPPAGTYYFRWGRVVVKPHVLVDTQYQGGRKDVRVWWCMDWYDLQITYGIMSPCKWTIPKVSGRELGRSVIKRLNYQRCPGSPSGSSWQVEAFREAYLLTAAALATLIRGMQFTARVLKEGSVEALRRPVGEDSVQPLLTGAGLVERPPPPPETA